MPPRPRQRPSAPRPPRAAPIDPARERVFRRLARQVKRFPDLDIGGVDTSGLSDRDAAFAHALDEAVTRRWITLEFLLTGASRRPFRELEARLRAALLAGAAQLLFMDKVPARAALFETTEWAKRELREGAGSVVTGVLRRILELRSVESSDSPTKRDEWTDRRDELPLSAGGAIALADLALPEDPLSRLAVATSTPIDLLRSLSRSLAMRDVRALALHGLVHPPTILNTAYAAAPLPNVVGAEESRVTPAAEGDGTGLRPVAVRPAEPPPAEFTLTPHRLPGHHVFKGPRSALIALLAARSDIWVQDPASSLAVQSAADLAARVVIDVCAGRGTKTRQLAATFPNAEIVATDADDDRRRDLREAFAGNPQVRVVGPGDLHRWREKADLVLLDVPCSNTGVLARRVEARYRAGDESIKALAATQRQIIADAIPLLSPGPRRGRILYSTCSLDERENDEITAWAARWHALEPSRRQLTLPAGLPGDPPENYTDGSFSALLG